MRRSDLTLTAAVVAALSLAACGGGDSGATDPNSTPATPTADVTSTSVVEQADPASTAPTGRGTDPTSTTIGAQPSSGDVSVQDAIAVLNTVRQNAIDAGLGGTDQAGEGPCPLDSSLDVSTVDPADEDQFEETWWFEQGAVMCWLGPLPSESSDADDPDAIGAVHVDEFDGDVVAALLGGDAAPAGRVAEPLRGGSLESACTAEDGCVVAWTSGDLAIVHISRSGSTADNGLDEIARRLDALVGGLAAFDPAALDYSSDGTA